MKEINIAKNIADLRKQKNLTQEQLAQALSISPQAISKWETGTCQPDTQTLPLIADCFGVSVDYLFYGKDISYDEIYEKIYEKVQSHPQMSAESYKSALTAFAYAHHGLMHGGLIKSKISTSEPYHITGENGVSLLSGMGYGAILTRDFFENITPETAELAAKILPALSDKNGFLICMAIVSMSDISYTELKEELSLEDEVLRAALDKLIGAGLVVEKDSKHKSLGKTYDIVDMYYTCLCIIMATIEVLRYGSIHGISCCMGYGDYPITLK